MIIATTLFLIEYRGIVKILSQIDLAVLGPVLFWPSAFSFGSSFSSSLDMSRYLLLPHSCSTVFLSLAVTSMRAESPFEKVPTVLVLFLISRLMHSIPLFALIQRQCSGGLRVKAKDVPVIACEPTLDAPEFFGSEVTHDLEAFKDGCDVIVTNRWSGELADVADKVYTRDLFKRD